MNYPTFAFVCPRPWPWQAKKARGIRKLEAELSRVSGFTKLPGLGLWRRPNASIQRERVSLYIVSLTPADIKEVKALVWACLSGIGEAEIYWLDLASGSHTIL